MGNEVVSNSQQWDLVPAYLSLTLSLIPLLVLVILITWFVVSNKKRDRKINRILEELEKMNKKSQLSIAVVDRISKAAQSSGSHGKKRWGSCRSPWPIDYMACRNLISPQMARHLEQHSRDAVGFTVYSYLQQDTKARGDQKSGKSIVQPRCTDVNIDIFNKIIIICRIRECSLYGNRLLQPLKHRIFLISPRRRFPYIEIKYRIMRRREILLSFCLKQPA